MNPLRCVLQRAPNGTHLVAEIKLTDDELKTIKTKLLLGYEVKGNYETSVYWYTNSGFPPAPPLVRNPSQVKAFPTNQQQVYNMEVNTKEVLEWLFEVLVLDNPDGK